MQIDQKVTVKYGVLESLSPEVLADVPTLTVEEIEEVLRKGAEARRAAEG